jgi:hypothetical protein
MSVCSIEIRCWVSLAASRRYRVFEKSSKLGSDTIYEILVRVNWGQTPFMKS